MTADAAGTITEIWRYPVKSMLGEKLTEATAGECGLEGDRAFALVDPASGKVISAKNPRKWAAMFTFRASLAGPGDVRVTLPSGEVVSLPGEGSLARIGKALGATVTVANQPAGGALVSVELPAQPEPSEPPNGE